MLESISWQKWRNTVKLAGGIPATLSTDGRWKTYTCLIALIYNWYEIESTWSWDRFSSVLEMRGDIYCCSELEQIWSIFLLINVNINRAIGEKRGWHFHTMRFSSESVTHPFSYMKPRREKKTEEGKNEHLFHCKVGETELMVDWNGLSKMSYPTVMSHLLMYFPSLFFLNFTPWTDITLMAFCFNS